MCHNYISGVYKNAASYGYLKSVPLPTQCYGWAADCGKLAASGDVRDI